MLRIFFVDSFTLVYIRLDSSTIVYWLVYTRLHLFVFLEQIKNFVVVSTFPVLEQFFEVHIVV